MVLLVIEFGIAERCEYLQGPVLRWAFSGLGVYPVLAADMIWIFREAHTN